MLGAIKARVVPFNVNYRYVAEELRYLLNDSGATAVVVHSQFVPVLAEVLPDLPHCASSSRCQISQAMICFPEPSGTKMRSRALLRNDRTSPGALTISTSCTPAAPPACPKGSCGVTAMRWWNASVDPKRRSPSMTGWPKQMWGSGLCSLPRSCTGPDIG
jgi:acyl-CoA synthetase (AMP-forming)/AMP-acid ligase II